MWQRSAWMQPSENMKPRAVLTKSAPTHSAHAARAEVTSLPEAMTRMRSFKPDSMSASTTRGSASSIDRLMWSKSACGAAPVPPSPPSIARKSGAYSRPRRSTFSASSLMKRQPPMAVLTPDGPAGEVADVGDLVEQLVDVGDVAMAVGADRVVARGNAADRRDLRRDLAAGQHAALAGLRALRELDLEGLHLRRELLRALRREACRRRSRTPYLAVPICMMTSQPPSR